MKLLRLRIFGCLGLFQFAILLSLHPSYAGSATWNLNPISGDWNTAPNWMPATVPNGPSDIATFDVSSTKEVALSADTEVDRVVFSAGASAFTIITGQSLAFTINGAGIVNDSGLIQQFIVTVDPDTFTGNAPRLRFGGNAIVGDAVELISGGGSDGGGGGEIEFRNNSSPSSALAINEGGAQNSAGGVTSFFDTASAADASLINKGGEDPVGISGGGGGRTQFFDNSRAASAAITNRAGLGVVAIGGSVTFNDNSTADDAIIVCEGAIGSGFGGATYFAGNASGGNALITLESGSAGRGGLVSFLDNSTAANATIIANGGMGRTGAIIAFPGGDGGTARFILRHGSAILANSYPPRDINFGSIEGSGTIWVGFNNLRIGTNNASTRFGGAIRQGAFSNQGSITKVGTGTFELGGSSTYDGFTTVEEGTLLINNLQGSGTGTGPVEVSAATLGGSGFIEGEVRVGLGAPGAFLAPGSTGSNIGTLTVRDRLTFHSQSIYQVQIDSDGQIADRVVARGVSIESGALIAFEDLGNSALPIGAVFKIIANRGGPPLVGPFANLAEGSTFALGINNVQASYQGGDGNDLTLTVVP